MVDSAKTRMLKLLDTPVFMELERIFQFWDSTGKYNGDALIYRDFFRGAPTHVNSEMAAFSPRSMLQGF